MFRGRTAASTNLFQSHCEQTCQYIKLTLTVTENESDVNVCRHTLAVRLPQGLLVDNFLSTPAVVFRECFFWAYTHFHIVLMT